MKTYNGTLMRILVGGKPVFHETDASFTTSKNFSEIASKDTKGAKSIAGGYTWGLSCNQLVSSDETEASVGTAEMIAKYLADETVEVQFSNSVVGDFVISGTVHIESFDVNATNGDVATGSFSFKGDGDFALGVVAA